MIALLECLLVATFYGMSHYYLKAAAWKFECRLARKEREIAESRTEKFELQAALLTGESKAWKDKAKLAESVSQGYISGRRSALLVGSGLLNGGQQEGITIHYSITTQKRK